MRTFARVSLVSLFLALGCATEPITGRKTFQFFSEQEMNTMGAQAYQQMLQEEPVSGDSRANAAVEEVGRRIAKVVDAEMQKQGREVYQWEFKVIDNPKTVNAWCLPGGKVAFYTGILPICKNEAGIAVVMGHEIAHAYAQHGNNRMSTGAISQTVLEGVKAALGSGTSPEISGLAMAALGVGSNIGLMAFGRDDESAADQIGLHIMARAGYDPREAVAFWQRMNEVGGGESPPEFLSTHPNHETRIADIQKLLPKVMPEYEQAKGGAAN
jgi:predicted Zn-dependent protease